MTKLPGILVVAVAALTAVSVWAQTAPEQNTVQHDLACEKRLQDTEMLVTPFDPRVVCDDQPSLATQECMVELLTKLKGKLRNKDFLEIYGVCRVEPGREIRDCMLSKIKVPFNDKSYKSAATAGNECLSSRKDLGKLPPGTPVVTKAAAPAAPKPAPKKK